MLMLLLELLLQQTLVQFDERLGRTSTWWYNFINGVEVPEEWRENFHMSSSVLIDLSKKVHLQIWSECHEILCGHPLDL